MAIPAGAQQSIDNVLNAMHVAGGNMAGVLGGIDGFGMKLLGILFAIMFFYNVILFMLDSSQKILVDVTKLVMTFSILAAMLMGWTSPVGSVGPTSSTSVATFFLSDIDGVTKKFTGGKDPTPEIVSLHFDAIGGMWKIFLGDYYNFKSGSDGSDAKRQEILDKKNEYLKSIGINPNEDLMKELTRLGRVNEYDDIMDEIISVTDTTSLRSNLVNKAEETIAGLSLSIVRAVSLAVEHVLAFAVIIVAMCFIFWSLVVFIFTINAGEVMLYVGLALGPMLIPFLLIDKLSFLFDGWLKLMVSGALYKMVGVLVALITMGAIKEVADYGSKATPDDSIYFLSLMIVFFAMLAAKLMEKADDIATTLSNGGTSAGGAGPVAVVISTVKQAVGKQQKNKSEKDNK